MMMKNDELEHPIGFWGFRFDPYFHDYGHNPFRYRHWGPTVPILKVPGPHSLIRVKQSNLVLTFSQLNDFIDWRLGDPHGSLLRQPGRFLNDGDIAMVTNVKLVPAERPDEDEKNNNQNILALQLIGPDFTGWTGLTIPVNLESFNQTFTKRFGVLAKQYRDIGLEMTPEMLKSRRHWEETGRW